MTNAYCNMGVPPRTVVKQMVSPVGRYVEFNIYDAYFTHPFKSPLSFPSPEEWLDDFLVRHGEALEAVPRPTGYMIGHCSEKDFCHYGKDHRICRDPILTVAILGRVSGTLYVPHRRILFGDWLRKVDYDHFMLPHKYVFPERYFPQFKAQERP